MSTRGTAGGTGFPGEEEFDPNTPMFLYVAKVSDEDRAKALAEAQ